MKDRRVLKVSICVNLALAIVVVFLSAAYLQSGGGKTPVSIHSYDDVIENLEEKTDNLISRTGYERGYCAALCALDWVDTNISEYITAPEYNKFILALTKMGAVEQALESGYGLCGSKVFVFNDIMKKMGYKSRYIQIFNITSIEQYNQEGMSNHVISEVYYDGGWHLFDPTFSMFYETERGEVLDYETLLALSTDEREGLKRTNELSLHNLVSPFDENGEEQLYNYFASPTKDIVISGSGTIHINADLENPFAQLPNHLGKYYDDQDDTPAETQFCIFTEKEPFNELALQINRFLCTEPGDIELHIKSGAGEGKEKTVTISEKDRKAEGHELVVSLSDLERGEIYMSLSYTGQEEGICLIYFDSIKIR